MNDEVATDSTQTVARGSLDLDISEGAEVIPVLRAVIYLRVSSAGQLNTDRDAEGFSIPAQREACQRKAESLGAVIVERVRRQGRVGSQC